jgi:mycothiol synthase
VGADEIREWFALPDIEALVAESPDGRLTGYADLTPLAERSRIWIDLRVPPGPEAAQVTDALLAAVEARAGRTAAPGAAVRTSVASIAEPRQACLRARGYELVRHSFQMRIELDGGLEAPRWPEGITVRAFRPGRDDEAVHGVQQETFADQYDYVPQSYEDWRAYAFIGAHDPSLWFLAEEGGEIAGICLCRAEWSGDADLGWVSVLGVGRPWRRRGLGLALLLHSFAELHARGNPRAGLGVDGLNPTGAVHLYERAGMHVHRRSDQFQKSLSP